MIKAILIDDEENGREMLKALLEKYFANQIKVLASVESVAKGVTAIHTHSPDLVFLDIEMPNESGFELFNKIAEITFEVIFITAFNDYAIKAFKVNALDYVLKPIDIDELKTAVGKAIKKIEEGNSNARSFSLLDQLKEISKPTKIGLPLSEGSLFVSVDEIVRCESESNYTNIYLSTGKHYLICRTLKEVEETLIRHNFFRVHRSHLINMQKIERYNKNDGGTIIMSDQSKIPLSRMEKEAFEKHLNSF